MIFECVPGGLHEIGSVYDKSNFLCMPHAPDALRRYAAQGI